MTLSHYYYFFPLMYQPLQTSRRLFISGGGAFQCLLKSLRSIYFFNLANITKDLSIWYKGAKYLPLLSSEVNLIRFIDSRAKAIMHPGYQGVGRSSLLNPHILK